MVNILHHSFALLAIFEVHPLKLFLQATGKAALVSEDATSIVVEEPADFDKETRLTAGRRRTALIIVVASNVAEDININKRALQDITAFLTYSLRIFTLWRTLTSRLQGKLSRA